MNASLKVEPRVFRPGVFLAVVCLVGAAVVSAQQAPPVQQAPVFRGGTNVVPLTVIVLDQNGVPVKDLRQSDFTVIENKLPREIVNFFPQDLHAGTAPPAETLQPVSRAR